MEAFRWLEMRQMRKILLGCGRQCDEATTAVSKPAQQLVGTDAVRNDQAFHNELEADNRDPPKNEEQEGT